MCSSDLNIVTAQIASGVGISGALMVFYRVFVMLACIAAVLLVMRQSLRVHQGERGALLVFGLSSSVIGTAYLSSVAFLPVSVAAVIFYLFPIFIVLAEPLVERTKMQSTRLGIALLAFAGTAGSGTNTVSRKCSVVSLALFKISRSMSLSFRSEERRVGKEC